MIYRAWEKRAYIALVAIILVVVIILCSAMQINDVTALKQLNNVSEVSTVTATVDSTLNSAGMQSSQINSNSAIEPQSSTVTTQVKNDEESDSSNTTETYTANKVEKDPKPESNTTVKNAPSGHSFKSYTNYKLLSSRSKQGKLQTLAYSDENGLRKVGEYYCVALGSYYGTTIGDCYIVTLSSGNTFKMVLCDAKADAHTDKNNQYTVSNGCMTEFYVDYAKFNSKARRAGTVSVLPGFEGDVVSIKKLDGVNVLV